MQYLTPPSTDPPYCDFGINPPVDDPLTSPHFKFNDQGKEVFRVEVSCYYDQPVNWDGRPSTLDVRSCTDHCSIVAWTQAQRDRWTEDFPMRTDGRIM